MLKNHRYSSKNFRNRNDAQVQFLVLHYTAVPLNTTLGIFTNDSSLAEQDSEYFANGAADPIELCKNEVSAHYVISENGEVFSLVNEEYAAYHAGVSFWNGVKNINNQSIGIEQVNIGYDWLSKFPTERAVTVGGSDKTWCTFTDAQIDKTIALCLEIIKRYNIQPHNIVGHTDVACGRKSDPGPAFPWERLAKSGVGIWYDISESSIKEMPEDPVSVSQNKLTEFGYDCPITGVIDEKFKNVMQAFQMHFRPSNIDGEVDLECIQILDSLCIRKNRYELDRQTISDLPRDDAVVELIQFNLNKELKKDFLGEIQDNINNTDSSIDDLIYQLENTIKSTKEHIQIKNYLESLKKTNFNLTPSQIILFKNFISEFEENINAGNPYPFDDRFAEIKNAIETGVGTILSPSLKPKLH